MQQHGDRLGPLDAAFLHVETPTRHMHVGALVVLDRPDGSEPVTVDRLRRLVASRLHVFPRFRQRVLMPPGGVSAPVWIDDAGFDLTRHVVSAAAPTPGTTAELHALADHLFSQPLDRRRPLWEFHVVEGLADGRAAVVAKTHHAMVDGASGIEVGALLFDPTVDGSADLPGGIGQFVGPQHEKGNEEDDEQFAAAEISHVSMLPTSVRVMGPRLGASTQSQTGIVDLRKRTFTEPIGRAHEVIGGDGCGGRPAQ